MSTLNSYAIIRKKLLNKPNWAFRGLYKTFLFISSLAGHAGFILQNIIHSFIGHLAFFYVHCLGGVWWHVTIFTEMCKSMPPKGPGFLFSLFLPSFFLSFSLSFLPPFFPFSLFLFLSFIYEKSQGDSKIYMKIQNIWELPLKSWGRKLGKFALTDIRTYY